MILGNIISGTKINISDEFNVVGSMDNIIHGLPTLIIGFDIAVKHFPDLDVITRKATNDIFWTFKKNQKREIFEEDLYNFIRFSYKRITDSLRYYFIDPLQLNYKLIKRLLIKLYGLSNPISYQHDNMIYIYGDGIIFGLDLTLLEFINLKIDKIIKKISVKSNVFLNKNQIFIEYKNKVENLDNQVKYIPYLYQLKTNGYFNNVNKTNFLTKS